MQKVQKVQKQQGFTLIELIIVIIILGILAVTAAPRFLDLSDDANQAAREGVEGAVASAATTTRAAWLVDGSSGTSVAVDGVNISVDDDDSNRDGYPVATAAGIGEAVDISSAWTSGLGQTSSAGDSYIFVDGTAFDSSSDENNCVIYTLDSNDEPSTSTGAFEFAAANASTCD